MIGILVQLVLSWLIGWFYEKGNLRFLGLLPTRKRLRDFLLFFLIAAACSLLGFLLRMWLAGHSWQINPRLSFRLLLEGSWFVLKAVLFEELIFRGVLLYILIKKTGAVTAIFISAIAFGIYHWFSHELWGNPVQMLIEFFTTGLFGWLLAYGYAKTYSLYVPAALHLGWNMIQMVIFSGPTIGSQLFVEVKPVPIVTLSYLSFFLILLLPLCSFLLINGWLLKQYKQIQLQGMKG